MRSEDGKERENKKTFQVQQGLGRNSRICLLSIVPVSSTLFLHCSFEIFEDSLYLPWILFLKPDLPISLFVPLEYGFQEHYCSDNILQHLLRLILPNTFSYIFPICDCHTMRRRRNIHRTHNVWLRIHLNVDEIGNCLLKISLLPPSLPS